MPLMRPKTVALILAIVTVLSCCAFSINSFGEAIPSKTAGPLNSDTTWTKASSPYILMGNTTVNMKLTIEPGVNVNLNGYSLIVYGTLVAKGSAEEKVNLYNGTVVLTGSDSVIQNAVIAAPVLLVLGGESPLIDNNQIDCRIIAKGGSPVISNNIITDGIHADAKDGPITITNNKIGCKSGYTGIYIQGIHADVISNTIVGNNCTGIVIYRIYTTGAFVNNTFSNCESGLSIFVGPGDQIDVTGNLFLDNDVGVDHRGGGKINIQDNTFTRNRIGITCYSTNVHNNNFCFNTLYNLSNDWLSDVDATNNWWGTNNKTAIKQTLYHDDNYSGVTNFEPFLQMPNPNAPAAPVDPIPAPTIDDDTGGVGSGLVWCQIVLPAASGGVVAVVLVIAAVFVWKNINARSRR